MPSRAAGVDVDFVAVEEAGGAVVHGALGVGGVAELDQVAGEFAGAAETGGQRRTGQGPGQAGLETRGFGCALERRGVGRSVSAVKEGVEGLGPGGLQAFGELAPFASRDLHDPRYDEAGPGGGKSGHRGFQELRLVGPVGDERPDHAGAGQRTRFRTGGSAAGAP